MDDREYIQDENETSDWLVYAEYVEWVMRSQKDGECTTQRSKIDAVDIASESA